MSEQGIPADIQEILDKVASENESGVHVPDIPSDPEEAQAFFADLSHEDLAGVALKLYVDGRHDLLTGIHNRRGFEAQYRVEAARMLRQDEEVPDLLAVIDLDRFKSINDSYGHDAGDIALKEAAGILRHSLRSYDILGRVGGDEFQAILKGVTLEQGRNIAERCRFNAETFNALQQQEPGARALPMIPTFSIGLAEIDYIKSLEENVKPVDDALYEAKEGGRNMVVVVPAKNL